MKLPCALLLVVCINFACVSRVKQEEANYDPSKDEKFLAQVELSALESTVALFDYPLTFDDAKKKLGGNDKLQWEYGFDRSYKETRHSYVVFSIITPHLKDKGYVVAFEGANLNDGSSIVTRVAVGYHTPLGSLYFSDLRDISPMLRDMTKEANKPAQTTTGLRPVVSDR